MTRVFIAVELPHELDNYMKELQHLVAPIGQLKFVKEFHCTLQFIGDVTEDELKLLKERLSTVEFSSFVVTTTGLGVFPTPNKARVVWLGLKGKLEELAEKVTYSIVDVFEPDKKFKAHMTLGRIKHLVNRDKLKRILEMEFDKKEFTIDSFKLIKSELTPKGPIYTDLEVYKAQ